MPELLRGLPERLAALKDLVLDLRWTWSHGSDALWRKIDAEAWDRARNPWTLLRDAPMSRLQELAADQNFVTELDRVDSIRRSYLDRQSSFAALYPQAPFAGVAFFSMEFGLGEALPLYAGGLGILAGDFLKTASDLGVPVLGIGLLYQEGYFRQMIDASGRQQEAYLYNDPASLPIQPVLDERGAEHYVAVDLPGRTLYLRVWYAPVGRARIYLLDSNVALNGVVDRGITAKLYGGGPELRLIQELVLGCAGWRLVERLAPEVEICHMNEGHAAFAVIERARQFMRRTGLSFQESLWATRAGNVFTTHTAVAAGFDLFEPGLVAKYAQAFSEAKSGASVETNEILPLGRRDPDDGEERFNMAYLAMRGSIASFGVSRLHGEVSRAIFEPLYQRWPNSEVPVGHVTNGVHIPTWDSLEADHLWTEACGKERWRERGNLQARIEAVDDTALWKMRAAQRSNLLQHVRRRLGWQLASRGLPEELVAAANLVLDPNVLTLGFARRFTSYKRPNLLLGDVARLTRLLNHPTRPAQLVIAGKAHPDDAAGKAMIHDWIMVAQRPELRSRLVFLEDYDIELAQELVQGVDVWIDTPLRPWEACGTSGMKILVNGGLNLSVLDGWWAEAYRPALGWAFGGGPDDAADMASLYQVLEEQVAPEFYDRDVAGVPTAWLHRVRCSMAQLTPVYSSNRMVRDYVEQGYVPAAAELRRRSADEGAWAKSLALSARRLMQHWSGIHLGQATVTQSDTAWGFSIPVYLDDVEATDVQVQLYADPKADQPAAILPMSRGEAISGTVNGFIYRAEAPNARPPEDYTARVVPGCPGMRIPAELPLIAWQG